MTTATKYSLNLSRKYVPNWGAWEVAREVVCNAMDAAPETMQIVPDGANRLSVTTPTVPGIAELFVIGEGSKAPGGDTIGQFGEGLKMAALAATRSGGSLVLNLPGKCVTFGFEDVMGVDVLHAHIEANPLFTEGYEAVIEMHGIAFACVGRFLPSRTDGPRDKAHDADMRVYVKGVYIAAMDLQSLWDWNLNSLEVNRDRSMVTTFNLTWAIGDWMEDNLTPDMAAQIVAKPDCTEGTKAIKNHKGGNCKLIADAWRQKHGDRAVIEDDDRQVNKMARREGYTTVKVNESELASLLAYHGVKHASAVLPESYDLESVDPARFAAQIAMLRSLDPMIAAPDVTLCVFKNRDDLELGRADDKENRIWLNEQCFLPGNEEKMVMTYLHEIAHVMSRSCDETRRFEYTLTQIAGRLALQALSSKEAAK